MTNGDKTITIGGGGLAGLTLGIGLRQQAIPVTVWEAGRYPRHRVCGEFISGEGQQTLARMGLRELLVKAGAHAAETCAFFSSQMASPIRRISSPALCLSRHVLDDLLARHFRQLGGELRENERWRDADFPEGVVRASGRRVQPVVDGWRWFGLKAHARNVRLAADLEMHLSPAGYVGVCRLNNDEVNVCGLFRRRASGADPPQRWPDTLRGAPGSLLNGRLAEAKFDEDSFCSVAGLVLQPQKALEKNECRIGDALTMIPPVTGNGMSMAFESAEIAIEPLAAYSRGTISWSEAQETIARRCDERFAQRLAWAAQLQRLLLAPRLQSPLVFLIPRWHRAWRLCFEHTR
jgi:2-polyprenyl-6-methoxyphenol hydroxylase-like FAD-dependent oxidoreductase